MIERALSRRLVGTLLENSLYGIGITGVNSVVGFLFWVAVARAYSARAIGLATALISAMTLVSALANVGGGVGLVERLPRRTEADDWSLTINASLLLCVVLSLVASAITIFALPLLSRHLSIVRSSPAYALMLAGGIVLWSLSINMDYLFVAERRVKYGFVRNAAFSIVKLPLVFVAAMLWSPTALALFGTWVTSSGLAFVIAVELARVRLRHRWSGRLRGLRAELQSMWGSLVGHHLINLGGTLPMYALPLIVTARLGVVENAWAYIGWMVGVFALVVSPTVSASLFAEGSHDVETFESQVRKSFTIIAILFIPVIVVVLLLGHTILGVFGAQYAQHSYGLVAVLALSAIPDAITNIYVVTMRVRGRLTTAAALNLAMALSAVILAWFLVRPLGVAGIAWAWLIAQSGGSVYAAIRTRIERTP